MATEQLERLADEQAALRRVATLVARSAPPADVFAAVAEELGRLLDVTATGLVRCERDDTATLLAGWGRLGEVVPLGTRLPVTGVNAISRIARTGRPARIDDVDAATGEIGAHARRLDVRSVVGTPIVVAGRLWGAMLASSRRIEPIPAGTELRMQEFAELVGVAISNVEAREELAASRARIAAAADTERRRVVRDLHDGAQQRLVHTIVTLKLARDVLSEDHACLPLVTGALEQAERANDELRKLVRGILPSPFRGP